MERNDKRPWERAREIEINIRTSIVRHVALLDDTLFLQCLMRELVRPQNLMFLLFSPGAFALASNIVQVALVGL